MTRQRLSPYKMTASFPGLTNLRPWLAGVVGLGLGFAGQYVFRQSGREISPSSTGQDTATRSQSSVRSAPLRVNRSATAARIGQLANATMADCEDRVRELCGANTRDRVGTGAGLPPLAGTGEGRGVC